MIVRFASSATRGFLSLLLFLSSQSRVVVFVLFLFFNEKSLYMSVFSCGFQTIGLVFRIQCKWAMKGYPCKDLLGDKYYWWGWSGMQIRAGNYWCLQFAQPFLLLIFEGVEYHNSCSLSIVKLENKTITKQILCSESLLPHSQRALLFVPFLIFMKLLSDCIMMAFRATATICDVLVMESPWMRNLCSLLITVIIIITTFLMSLVFWLTTGT